MTRRTLNQLLIGSPRAFSSLHLDAVDYRNRILAKGANIRQSDFLAIDKFVKSIHSNNLRSLIVECYPFAGDNLSAALTKLWHVGGSDFTNVGFTDLNYSVTTGITGNGLGYLNSNFIPNSSPITNTSGSIGAYNRTNSVQFGMIAGGTDANGSAFNLIPGWGDGLNYFDCYNTASLSGRLVTQATPNYNRLNIGTRVSAGDSRYFRDGIQVASIATTGGGPPINSTFWFAYNNNGVAGLQSTKSVGFGFMGRGLTPAQVTTLTTIVNQLMTDLGRAV